MTDGDIREAIARFPSWHYQFDLNGHLTPIADRKNINRQHQRRAYFFDPFVRMLGGSLAGKRVLDLGCNAGYWSLLAAQAGADFVLGIDGRQMCVDQSNFVFEVNGIDPRRYRFGVADIFETDLQELGTFDIVLCLGLLYHVSKPMELLQQMARVNSDLAIIDTRLSRLPGASLEFLHESTDVAANAVDQPLVMIPSRTAVIQMAEQVGYRVVTVAPQFSSYEGAADYRFGFRRAFICSKTTGLSALRAEGNASRLADGCFWTAEQLGRSLRRALR